jgi:hypothetical protein
MSGCDFVAFGDLGTQLILRTSGPQLRPQEQLDQIARNAAQMFALQDAALPGMNATACKEGIVVLTPSEARLLLRSDRNKADFLCCAVPLNSPIAEIEGAARQFLNNIDGA